MANFEHIAPAPHELRQLAPSVVMAVTLEEAIDRTVLANPESYFPILSGFESPCTVIKDAQLSNEDVKKVCSSYSIRGFSARTGPNPTLFVEDEFGVLHERLLRPRNGESLTSHFTAELLAFKILKDLGLLDTTQNTHTIRFTSGNNDYEIKPGETSSLKDLFNDLVKALSEYHKKFASLASSVTRHLDRNVDVRKFFEETAAESEDEEFRDKVEKDIEQIVLKPASREIARLMARFEFRKQTLAIILGKESVHRNSSKPAYSHNYPKDLLETLKSGLLEEDFYEHLEANIGAVASELGLVSDDPLSDLQLLIDLPEDFIESKISASVNELYSSFSILGSDKNLFVAQPNQIDSGDAEKFAARIVKEIKENTIESLYRYLTPRAVKKLSKDQQAVFKALRPPAEADWPDELDHKTAFLIAADLELIAILSPVIAGQRILERSAQQALRLYLLKSHFGEISTWESVDQNYLKAVLANNLNETDRQILEEAESSLGQTLTQRILENILSNNPDGELQLNYYFAFLRHKDKFTKGELKSLLDQALQSYDPDRPPLLILNIDVQKYNSICDRLSGTQKINTIQELKKRIDLMAIGEEGYRKLENALGEEKLAKILAAPNVIASEILWFVQSEGVDKLISGELDLSQPLEAKKETYLGFDLAETLKQHLDPATNYPKRKKLYHALKQLLKDKDMDVKDLFKEVPKELESPIVDILSNLGVKLGPFYDIEVLDKSDWRGWIGGYTAHNCFRFNRAGSDKHDVKDALLSDKTQIALVSLRKSQDTAPITLSHMLLIVRPHEMRNHPYWQTERAADFKLVDSIILPPESRPDVIVIDNIECANNYTEHYTQAGWFIADFFNQEYEQDCKIGDLYSDIQFPGASLVDSFWKFEEDDTDDDKRLARFDSAGQVIYELPDTNKVPRRYRNYMFRNAYISEAHIVRRMELTCYPNEKPRPRSQLIEILSQQEGINMNDDVLDNSLDSVSPFFTFKGSEEAGYVLCTRAESIFFPGEKAIYIDDFAILPKFRNLEILFLQMDRVLMGAKANRMSIEFAARDITSYRLMRTAIFQNYLKRRGFKIRWSKDSYTQDGRTHHLGRIENLALGRYMFVHREECLTLAEYEKRLEEEAKADGKEIDEHTVETS